MTVTDGHLPDTVPFADGGFARNPAAAKPAAGPGSTSSATTRRIFSNQSPAVFRGVSAGFAW